MPICTRTRKYIASHVPIQIDRTLNERSWKKRNGTQRSHLKLGTYRYVFHVKILKKIVKSHAAPDKNSSSILTGGGKITSAESGQKLEEIKIKDFLKSHLECYPGV